MTYFQISDVFDSQHKHAKPTKTNVHAHRNTENDVHANRNIENDFHVNPNVENAVSVNHNVEKFDETELTTQHPVIGKNEHHEGQPSMEGSSLLSQCF